MTSMKKVLGATLMLAGLATANGAIASAQSGAVVGTGEMVQSGDYDINRPCRFYLVRKLPAPVRCLLEFFGSWGPGAYVDGDFIFRDRAQWLLWRDREDYRHWRQHEFHWRAGSESGNENSNRAGVKPAMSIICPAQVAVKFAPSHPAAFTAAGWTANEDDFLVQLDPANPPHFSGVILTCTYKLGSQPGAFMLYQSVGARQCAPRSDGTGFDCTP